MAQTYLVFDFGTDEEKAQLARHKLEGWKQAFRLDKKLLYTLNRDDAAAENAGDGESAAKPEASTEPASKSSKAATKAPKSSKSPAKSKSRGKSADAEEAESAGGDAAANGKVTLLVRLYFSGHEKLTEQRWLERIPAEEPFKEASPRIVRQGEPQFDELVQEFVSLE